MNFSRKTWYLPVANPGILCGLSAENPSCPTKNAVFGDLWPSGDTNPVVVDKIPRSSRWKTMTESPQEVCGLFRRSRPDPKRFPGHFPQAFEQVFLKCGWFFLAKKHFWDFPQNLPPYICAKLHFFHIVFHNLWKTFWVEFSYVQIAWLKCRRKCRRFTFFSKITAPRVRH